MTGIRKKRVDLTISEKLDAVAFAREHGSDKAARRFNVVKRTIQKWMTGSDVFKLATPYELERKGFHKGRKQENKNLKHRAERVFADLRDRGFAVDSKIVAIQLIRENDQFMLEAGDSRHDQVKRVMRFVQKTFKQQGMNL
jgi:hypothetical protein